MVDWSSIGSLIQVKQQLGCPAYVIWFIVVSHKIIAHVPSDILIVAQENFFPVLEPEELLLPALKGLHAAKILEQPVSYHPTYIRKEPLKEFYERHGKQK